MGEGEPEPAAVDIVQPFDLLERLRRDAGEVAAPGFVAGQAAPLDTRVAGTGPHQVRGHRLGGRRGSRLRPGVTQAQVDLELFPGGVAQVAGAVELVLPVVGDDAFVPVIAAAEEIADRLGPALHGHRASNRMPGRERRPESAGDVVLDQVEMPYRAGRVLVVDAFVELRRIRQPVGAGPKLGRPDRPPDGAPLGDDLDDPVRCLGAVERRGRRPLEHLDRRDVVRVEVIDPGRVVATPAETDAVRAGGVVRPNAVDEDVRLGAQAEGADPADAGDAAGAELPAETNAVRAGGVVRPNAVDEDDRADNTSG